MREEFALQGHKSGLGADIILIMKTAVTTAGFKEMKKQLETEGEWLLLLDSNQRHTD